jgi:transcriptional regulator with XRE-family HTH domain
MTSPASKALQKRVATKIRAILKKRKKSAEKLALELELSVSYFYAFLNGRKGITLETISRIAEGLDVDPKEFF